MVLKVGGESEESVTVLEKDGEAMTVDVGKESKRPSTFGLQGIGPRRMGIRKNNNIVCTEIIYFFEKKCFCSVVGSLINLSN